MTTPDRPSLDALDPNVERAYVDRAVERLREVTGYDAEGVTYAAGVVWVDADVLMRLLDAVSPRTAIERIDSGAATSGDTGRG